MMMSLSIIFLKKLRVYEMDENEKFVDIEEYDVVDGENLY